jgi:hypothetical protein
MPAATTTVQMKAYEASGMKISSARFAGRDSHFARNMAREGRGDVLPAKTSFKVKQGISLGMRDSKHRRFSSLGCVYGISERNLQKVSDALGDARRDLTRNTRGGAFRTAFCGRFEEPGSLLHVERKEGLGEAAHAIGFDHEVTSERLKRIGCICMGRPARHSRFSMVGEDFSFGRKSVAGAFTTE